MRGLKPAADVKAKAVADVAPLVGAWIETLTLIKRLTIKLSHPSWVRGLKLSFKDGEDFNYCRTPRGCVD